MKLKHALILLLAGTLTASLAQARDYAFYTQYGLGNGGRVKPDGNHKILALGFSGPIFEQLRFNLIGGGYFDHRRHLSTGFTFSQIGIRINPLDWFYFENYFGPGYISQTDPFLSTNFQFSTDIGFGFQEDHVSFGFKLKHISNAGIKKPNAGRNYLLIKVRYALF